VTSITDLATGDSWAAPAAAGAGGVLRLLAAAGSKGVSVGVAVNVGKVPTQALLQNLTAAIASPSGAAAIARGVAVSAAAATGQPASAFASGAVSAPAVANSLFSMPPVGVAPAAASGGGGGSDGAGAATAAAAGGAVGGVAVVAAIAAVAWYFVARDKNKKTVVSRLREADERHREADVVIATVNALNPLGAGAAGDGASSAGLVVRNIVRENTELKAKLAAAAAAAVAAAPAAPAAAAAPPKLAFVPTTSP